MARHSSAAAAIVLTACLYAPAGSAQTGVAGEWDLTFKTDQGEISATLTLKQSGAELTGTLSSPQGDGPVKGSVDGSNVKWTMDFSGPNGSITIDFAAEVAGLAMKGEANFGQGSILFYGKKKQ
jgi:hypothetical protein